VKGNHRVDEIIEEELEKGRVTTSYIADVADVSKSYVNQRLSLMVERNEVEKVHRGLYQIK
jgi:DeoR/GlpR family transcriptional regulator of sugar metabolism